MVGRERPLGPSGSGGFSHLGAFPATSATFSSRGRLWFVDDDELLARAEEALTEIKVAHGLSDRHAAVLAALRIRLKGSAGGSLEEMLEAAGDLESNSLEDEIAKAEGKRKPSLDDLLKEPEPKPDWPS